VCVRFYCCGPGLPDSYFQTKPSNFGRFWKALEFYDHLVNFCGHLLCLLAICYVLWLFVIVSTFWWIVSRKIWQPCLRAEIKTVFLRLRASFTAWKQKAVTSELNRAELESFPVTNFRGKKTFANFDLRCSDLSTAPRSSRSQGCQIFIYTIYQHGEKLLLNYQIATKLPNCHKI
jgi:hypothetical protein